MLSYAEIGEVMGSLADELEQIAETHRQLMREADDPCVFAENSGISRGLLFVASKIRTAQLAAECDSE